MDSRGLYLNKWTPDFNPELDIPRVVPVSVRLPHLPLHCWGDESVRAIGNAVGKYIDRNEPKDNIKACSFICVEFDLGKGLPEAIKLNVDNWTHIHQLDYDQIPFKCKVRHEYSHFANRYTKLVDVENTPQEEQWETVNKNKSGTNPKPNPNASPSSRIPPIHSSSSLPNSSPIPPNPDRHPDPQRSSSSSNPFHILSPPEDIPTPATQTEPLESPLPLIISSSSLPPDPLST